MNYNKLTPQEESLYIRQQNLPSKVNMIIFMKMERLSAEGVTLRYFHQKANLMLGVDGQVLMKVTQMQ